MAAGARCDCNQAIDPGFCCFFGVAPGRNIVEHQPAIAMDRIHYFFGRAQAGDDDRYFVLDADRQVSL